MKKILKKMVLILIMVIPAIATTEYAYGAEATLGIRVAIVQCGSRDKIIQACQRDDRCCGFVDAEDREQLTQQEPAAQRDTGYMAEQTPDTPDNQVWFDTARNQVAVSNVSGFTRKVAKITRFFDRLDTDLNGFVTFKEFEKRGGRYVSEETFFSLDQDQDEVLSFDDFSYFRFHTHNVVLAHKSTL